MAFGINVRNIQNLFSGENPEQPWLNYSNNSETNAKLERAYKSVITLTAETIEDKNDGGIKSKSNVTSGFYDALLLYAHAVSPFINNASAAANRDIRINVFDIITEMWGKTFKGNTKCLKFKASLSILMYFYRPWR